MEINAIPKTFHLIHKTKINDRTFAVLGINENDQGLFSLDEIREMFYGDAPLDTLIQGDGFFLRLLQAGDLVMISEHGVPWGWVGHIYWSATPSGSDHAPVPLTGGFVHVNLGDHLPRYVAFEVIE